MHVPIDFLKNTWLSDFLQHFQDSSFVVHQNCPFSLLPRGLAFIIRTPVFCVNNNAGKHINNSYRSLFPLTYLSNTFIIIVTVHQFSFLGGTYGRKLQTYSLCAAPCPFCLSDADPEWPMVGRSFSLPGGFRCFLGVPGCCLPDFFPENLLHVSFLSVPSTDVRHSLFRP